MWEPYVYQPLNRLRKHIRLLSVLPGAYEDDLQADFKEVSLSSEPPPPYETISYVWGDSTRRAAIVLCGCRLPVPQNTYAALRRMRLPDETRTMWIDAVCINQADMDERSAQVSMMGDIYRMASGNLIHLSEDSIFAPQAFKMVVDLDKDIRAATNNYSTFANTIRSSTTGDRIFTQHQPYANMDVSVIEFTLCLPWFR
jgi:hypothetical protein